MTLDIIKIQRNIYCIFTNVWFQLYFNLSKETQITKTNFFHLTWPQMNLNFGTWPLTSLTCEETPYLDKIVCFSIEKRYTDEWVIERKIGIEKVKFMRFGRHIHVQFLIFDDLPYSPLRRGYPNFFIKNYSKGCTFRLLSWFKSLSFWFWGNMEQSWWERPPLVRRVLTMVDHNHLLSTDNHCHSPLEEKAWLTIAQPLTEHSQYRFVKWHLSQPWLTIIVWQSFPT